MQPEPNSRPPDFSGLWVACCGMATAAIVAVLTQPLAGWLDSDLTTVMWFGVVPVGAMGLGMTAASGYYFGATRFHHMPGPMLFVNTASIGLSTYLAIRYLAFQSMTLDDGTLASDHVSFWQYMTIRAEHMTYKMRGSDTSFEPGAWIEWVQAGGFLLGGVAVYGFLLDRRRCVACRKYFASKDLLREVDLGQFEAFLGEVDVVLPEVYEAVAKEVGRKPFRGFTLVLDRCPSCGGQQLAVVAEVKKDDRILAGVYRISPGQAELIGARQARLASSKAA